MHSDEDLSLPFAETGAMVRARIERARNYGGKVLELTPEIEQQLRDRDREIERQLDAIRNPPIEQRFARIVGAAYAGCRLDNFVIGLAWTEKQRQQAESVLKRLRSCLKDLEAGIRLGRGIVLCGPPGVGKDHLLAGLLWEALTRNCAIAWTNGAKFSASALDQFSEHRVPERQWLERWVEPSVLAISDPDGTREDGLTGHVKQQLYNVLDARIREGKSTWITINGTSPKVWAERLDPRNWDRLAKDAWILHCDWPSGRKPRGEV